MYINLRELNIVQLEELVQRYPWYTFARVVLLEKMAHLGREYLESNVRTSYVFLQNRRILLRKLAGYIPSGQETGEAHSEVQSELVFSETLADLSASIKTKKAVTEEITAFAKESAVAVEEIATSLVESEQAVEEAVAAVEGSAAVDEEISINDIDFNIVMEEIRKSPSDKSNERSNVAKPYMIGGDYFTADDFKELDNENNISKKSEVPDFKYTMQRGDGEEETGNTGLAFDDDGFYTETLAQIYAQQGYYQQAIEVYSKLSLLYPEKSAYFASLVKEIKLKK